MQSYEWIHYSTKEIDSFLPENNKRIVNNVKPVGLYASVGVRWLQLLYDREELYNDDFDGLYIYRVEPSKDAVILDITPQTVETIGNVYRFEQSDGTLVPRLDWVRIAECYDGVFVDVDNIKQSFGNDKTEWYWFACAFDVPTLCMWRHATIRMK